MSLDPEKVKLTSVAKAFEYEKISREIDGCEDVAQLRNLAKCFLKLQMRQQEMMQKQLKMFLNDNFSSML